MNNRSSLEPVFPMLSFLNCLSVILYISPLSYLHHCLLLLIVFFLLPVQTGCTSVGSHMLLAESQLSLLSQSDGPGHTSGSPWQESPPAQPPPSPPPALWSRLDRDLSWALTPPETTKPIQNQNNGGKSVFHLRAKQRLHMLLLRAFFSPTQHLSIIA